MNNKNLINFEDDNKQSLKLINGSDDEYNFESYLNV